MLLIYRMSQNRCNRFIWLWFITETSNSMSADVSLDLIWILYGYSWRSFLKILCNDVLERLNSWEGLRSLSNRISHRIHIVRTPCSQLPAKSGIFCLLLEIVYWPCSLKIVNPIINLAFLGIIVTVKQPAKFCLYNFERFFFQISDVKYFSSLVQGTVIDD